MNTSTIRNFARGLKRIGVALAALALWGTTAQAAHTWNLASGGDWDTTTANWTTDGGATTTTFTDDGTVDVIFDKTAGGTIAISADMSPLSTTVSAASGTYTFSGEPVDSGPLTKSGNGRLNLNVTPANFSSIALQGGVLFLNAANSFAPSGASFNMPDTTVESGATLVGSRAHAAGNLTMNGGRYYDENGWSGSWTGPIYLSSDSYFGRSEWYCYGLTLNGTVSGPGGLIWESYNNNSTLTLAVGNSYAGPTMVKSGTLKCNHVDALSTNALSISASGAKVNLNYSGEHPVAALTLGGVPQAGGTHGSSSSIANYPNDTYFVAGSSGMVRVPASSAKEMLTFSFGALGAATITDTNITMQVPFGTDVTALAPTYTVSDAATGAPVSGTTRDFTTPQTYTVTAQDLSTKAYTVTVVVTVIPDIHTWINPTAAGDWSVVANWTNEEDIATAPLAGGRSSYTLNFTRTGTYTATHDLNSGFLLNQLNFGGTVTLENGTEVGNSLTFTNNAATLPQINQNSGSQVKIYNDLELGADVTFGGSGGGWVDFFGAISGAGSLTKDGSGTLAITKDATVENSFTGGTIINSGTLRMNLQATLGSGPITLNGGSLFMFRFYPYNALTVNGGKIISENGFGNAWNGPVTLNTDLTIDLYWEITFNGIISGPGGLTINQSPNGKSVILTAVNEYTGDTRIINGGKLKVTGNSINDANTLIIDNGKVEPVGTEEVFALYFGTEKQAYGTYGATGSGADNIDDTRFTGTAGVVKVIGHPRGMLITIL